MIIHKLLATCPCNNETCIGHGDVSVVNITLSANDEEDIDLLTELLGRIEAGADRVKAATIRVESLQLMRAALEDVYKIPEFAKITLEAIGLSDPPKEEEDPFKDLDELELKEIG